ncbi:MAG: NAD(P)(+) transhydrogenase (Re/Si-specific) subunit beta, partial [Rhodobacteraceae bacterium]|nr:NAD(P)(+) transhydrogenase (Re/Si-specific) subunit beta [Paracoccaceae bacterium]
MSYGLVQASYIAASVLFILALGGLSNQEKAKRAIWYGIIGMAIAVVATVLGPQVQSYWLLVITISIGAVAGVIVAQRVEMTEMPQLVAALHSFVGLAAVFIGLNADMMLSMVEGLKAAGTPMAEADLSSFGQTLWKKDAVEIAILKVEVFLGIFIGAVTFTGSVIAFGKLAGKIDGKPTQLPGGHMLNAGALVVAILLGLLYFNGAGIWTMVLVTLIAGFIGWHLILGIGGADMPVVVSMLNSYSGWAAAAIGFTLGNDLLIVVGALVGSSGAILSYIMCVAMNRKFINVILGGFGGTTGPAMEIEGEQIAIDADGVAAALEEASSVVIVPGYGMA